MMVTEFGSETCRNWISMRTFAVRESYPQIADPDYVNELVGTHSLSRNHCRLHCSETQHAS